MNANYSLQPKSSIQGNPFNVGSQEFIKTLKGENSHILTLKD